MRSSSALWLGALVLGTGCHLLVQAAGPETCDAAQTPPACSADALSSVTCEADIVITTPCAEGCNPDTGRCAACGNGVDDGGELCFTAQPEPIPTGADPTALLASDVDEDGAMDLTVANSAEDTIVVLKNNGLGQFAGFPITVGDTPFALATADFNGDTHLDLAVANRTSGEILTLLSQFDASGNFVAPIPGPPVASGGLPISLAAGDADADGAADLIFLNLAVRQVFIAKGDGTGAFDPAFESFAINDHQADAVALAPTIAGPPGKLDVITVSGLDNTLTLLIAPSPPPAPLAPIDLIDPDGESPAAVSLGNFSADGSPPDATRDFAIAYRGTSNVLVFLNSGANPPAKIQNLAVGDGPEALVVFDLDGDGDDDIATADGAAGSVSILKNLGDGRFAARQVIEGLGAPLNALSAADFNGDGFLDLAVLSQGTNSVRLLLGGI